MSEVAPLMPDEMSGLLGFLEMQRAGVRNAVRGLTDEQARLTPIPSTTLSLGGLLKHLVIVEISWVHADILREPEESETPEQRAAAFTLLPEETVWPGGPTCGGRPRPGSARLLAVAHGRCPCGTPTAIAQREPERT